MRPRGDHVTIFQGFEQNTRITTWVPMNSKRNQSENGINRRKFIGATALAGVAAGALATTGPVFAKESRGDFNLHFAPHPGMFRASAGKDVIEQIKFAHDQGFTAWEMNGLGKESVEKQEAVGKTLADLEMKMGVFVGYGSFDQPTFAVKDDAAIKDVLEKIKTSVDIAKRCNAKWFTVVPGSIDQQFPKEDSKWNKYGGGRLADGYQLANVIDLLRRCCEILEPYDLTMVLEPLNWRTNHGGAFLRDSDQAFAICRAVNSPSCKILFDIYHQQITEGNLIPNIDMCWSEIAYFQAGDNPGRKEPGTGEIHYGKVFQHIYDKSKADNREFVIGMEHGNSTKGKPGEHAVIDAYKKVNPAQNN